MKPEQSAAVLQFLSEFGAVDEESRRNLQSLTAPQKAIAVRVFLSAISPILGMIVEAVDLVSMPAVEGLSEELLSQLDDSWENMDLDTRELVGMLRQYDDADPAEAERAAATVWNIEKLVERRH